MPDNVDKIAAIDEDQFRGNHTFLAERKLEPLVNETNSNRGQMFAAHIQQLIGINQAEPPLIATGFEQQIFDTSSLGYKKIEPEQNLMILKKIVKNKYNYILLVQDVNTKEYDILERRAGINLTEHFGTRYHNEVIDRLQEGDQVSDEILYHDDNYDSSPQHNAQYGLNLNAAFVPFKGYTNEDAAVISQSAAEKLGSTFVKKVRITLNTNDLPLNLYGNGSVYRSYPGLGEKFTKDIPLMAVRRLNYNEFPYLKDEALRKIKKNDRCYIAEGQIIDADIYCNQDIEAIAAEPYNTQLAEEYRNLKRFYGEFIEAVAPIVAVKSNKDKISTALYAKYNRILHLDDDEDVKLTSDGSQFDKLIVDFTIMYTDIAGKGSKITNRLTDNSLDTMVTW